MNTYNEEEINQIIKNTINNFIYIRTVRAFLPDGSDLGVLAAAGKWSLSPHTLQMRRHINQLVHRKLLHFTTWDDPIFCYTVYLKNEAAKGKKKDANKYAHAQGVVDSDRNERLEQPEKQVIDSEKKMVSDLEEARSKIKEAQEANQAKTPDRKYKAITY